jgi:hypothetical protein
MDKTGNNVETAQVGLARFVANSPPYAGKALLST